MTSIAVIPARGGSRRIHRKNLKLIDGVPAICRAIRLAQEANIFESVVVSTDDDEIVDLALSEGAKVPFIRSPELSDDYSTTWDVISDCIRRLRLDSFTCHYVCCLYPVTPLLKVSRIIQANDIIKLNKNDYVFPAIRFQSPVERSFGRGLESAPKFIFPEYILARTQELSPAFHDAGQFYFGTVNAWLTNSNILGNRSTFIELKKYEVIDVDTLEDWEFMEQLYKIRSLDSTW